MLTDKHAKKIVLNIHGEIALSELILSIADINGESFW